MNTHTQQIGTQAYHCDESGLIQPIESPDVIMTWISVRDPDGARMTVKAAYYHEAVALVEEAWPNCYFIVALEGAL